ncbi:MAG: hypothetical protein IT579_08815, partial [Verrucomicrobia subdivision 3 bacterium]|nr:hypothetical protein [Limisphaerales bacterium]
MKSLTRLTQILAASIVASVIVVLECGGETGATTDGEKLVGQPVDIAPSAYQFRSDRKAEDNQPESWLALMHYANQPLNKPVDINAPAIKEALCGLLWEEIRPVQQLELTWATDAKQQPAPEELAVATLNNQGASSSWWNNLSAMKTAIKPAVSRDGKTYVYRLGMDTCGIVVSIPGQRASDFAVPTVRVLVAVTWKQMDVEIEWGFDPATAKKAYSGRVETYDGRVAALRPLDGDRSTTTVGVNSWRSLGKESLRRGVKFRLFYIGTSKWRPVQPFTSQRDDVARTIVTLWTQAGNFSFLASDLENGPILAPEYGFFVRRTSALPTPPTKSPPELRIPLATKMNSIAGSTELLGWGSDSTPWFGGNPLDNPVTVQGIVVPARRLALHPGPADAVVVGWRSPIQGAVKIKAGVAHGQRGGNGIEWWIAHEAKADRKNLAHGTTDGSDAQAIPTATDSTIVGEATVEPGDQVSLVVGPKGPHQCDTTIIELIISEVGGRGRVWNLTRDVVNTLHAGNPHADGQGNSDVWQFYSEKIAAIPPLLPVTLNSQAGSAREFIQELRARQLCTIRQRTRAHEEQTWEGAVTAMRGSNLPPHPQPPVGSEPFMQVEVPSERLTAQWNLGAWHLLRHCEKNPTTGRLWFNDYPYGILGAETYLVLAALDLMGAHTAAADGFDQWVSLPLDPNSTGHHS